ncbi:proline-rich protein HaeIII subfamily 1 [Drosophila busckii]|uniref:proline-rich protein HaeIII subfamily 1 n=1 Tax=Drosophila busckii TaxID=30019 RepID=UPI00083EC74A|nr:proline-rich protein HaeIII subfamily 1 [Drosophila busckii]
MRFHLSYFISLLLLLLCSNAGHVFAKPQGPPCPGGRPGGPPPSGPPPSGAPPMPPQSTTTPASC